MLTIYTAAGAVPLHIDDYYVKQLYSGYDELIFSIDIYDPEYQLIQEESVIREESDDPVLFLVKAIDGGKTTAQIKCQIDLDAWKTSLSVGYNSGSNTVGDIARAVRPTGWTVIDNSGKTFKRTISLAGATALDVLEACRDTFDVTFRFDNIAQTVTIIDPESFAPLGAYMTRDLNLTEINYKGKSTDFATRLYAVGKDGMTFADINGGKAYVENHDYSERIICAFWEDDRYTTKENLLADAQSKIDELAKPSRSYSCSIVDLAAVDPKYGFQDFTLFSVVTLIDTNRNAGKVNHQVVEVWRYPFRPEKNSVVLSTVPPRIQSQVRQILYDMKNPNSDFQSWLMAAQLQATADILGAKGGAVRLLDTNDDGYPDTLYIADDPDPDRAAFVWRFNYMGWGASTNGFDGPFQMAATINAGIVADYITAGTMLADRIRGGTLWLGGNGNINGQITVDDASGTRLATIDNNGISITDVSNPYSGAYTQLYSGGILLSARYDNSQICLVQGTAIIVSVLGVETLVKTVGVYLGGNLRLYNASNTKVFSYSNDSGSYRFDAYAPVVIDSNFSVTGTKNRIVKTKDYGERLLYSYEMPAPMFGDCGEGEIGEDGTAFVWLDPIFAETISTDQYQVFLQKYGEGDLCVAERRAGCFLVRGTAGLAFGWELKAKQADFDQRRIDQQTNQGAGNAVDYAAVAANYFQTLTEGRYTA